jgi:hypothetical protein
VRVHIAGRRDLKGCGPVGGRNASYEDGRSVLAGLRMQRETGDLQASVIPPSGVMGSCCSLIVTVLLEGSVHSIVRG